VLAIMFTDIVGSTGAAEAMGDQAYSRLRHVHDELFKRTITRDGAGTIIKQIGDSFLCVFSEPTAAVQRAVEFQRAVRANKENLTAEGYTLTVRIGIHLGQVAVEDALRPDVFGRHVNMAARIEALATGGQVLTSRSVWENASGWVAGEEGPGIGYIAYGKARLKGFDDPVEVFGFHAKETGALPAPAAIRKRRVQATLLASLAAIVVLVGMFALFQRDAGTNPVAGVPFSEGKPYYFQFDFSALSKDSTPAWVDSNAIKSAFVSQAIAVFAPDPVWVEEDLADRATTLGMPYIRRDLTVIHSWRTWSDPLSVAGTGRVSGDYTKRSLTYGEYQNSHRSFFKDTMGLAGAVFVKALKTRALTDTFWMWVGTDLYKGINADLQISRWEDKGLVADDNLNKWARNVAQEIVHGNKRILLGTVIAVGEGVLTFRLAPDVRISKGAKVSLKREFVGEAGHMAQIEENRELLVSDWSRETDGWVEENLKWLKEDSAKLREEMSRRAWRNGDRELFGVRGEVLSVVDSMVQARWTYYKDQRVSPWMKPRPKDVVYLAY